MTGHSLRHLTSAQKAVLVVEVLPTYREQAKERQGHGNTAPGRSNALGNNAQSVQADRARDEAAALIGISGRQAP